MGVPSGAQPSPGSVSPGELYLDAQTRMGWLGVPTSIHASQSVVVADIVGLLQQDAADSVADRAYTDTQIATRAPTVHTHTIAQVTGLQAALDESNNGLPGGCIVIWSGIIGDIPGGWAICNGQNGTPDTRERVIRGAGGNMAALSTGGANTRTLNTGLAGGHNHGGLVGSTTLSLAQIPAHSHTVNDSGHGHAGSTALASGNHTHNIGMNGNDGNGTTPQSANGGTATNASTDSAGSHTHSLNITVGVTGISLQNAGGGGGHDHSISSAADHQHSVSVDIQNPYIVLAYIMKV